MSKILFTDLDDTLLTTEKTVCEENQIAIHRLLEGGHKIVLTSGRSLPSVQKQANRLHLTFDGCYLICYNGGEIYDVYRKETLYKKRLPMNIVKDVFQMAEERNLHIQTYDNEYVYCHDDGYAIRRYCQEMDCSFQVVENVFAVLSEEPSKILCAEWEDPSRLEELRHAVEKRHGDLVDVFYSSPYFLEVVPKGTNKGSAVKKLSSILGVPLEDTVATGDAMNDIEMIQTAHVGVAMANATDDVKAVANYITTVDHNHGGVAEAIEKFIL